MQTFLTETLIQEKLQKTLIEKRNLFGLGLTSLIAACSADGAGGGDNLSFKADKAEAFLEDRIRFYHFVGYVKGVADQLSISIRCGADWDGDNDLFDQTFFDLPHFELKGV